MPEGVENSAASPSAIAKRRHRPGLQRVSIACERCRTRKNKCDRKVPECSTCKAAGAACVVVDRLTNRQYPRGHVEGLELEVEKLSGRIKDLERQLQSSNIDVNPNHRHGSNSTVMQGTPVSISSSDAQERPSFEHIADDLNAVPHDVTRSQRYVGDSSGLFFGNIVQAVLLQADYKGEHGPVTDSLRLKTAERRIETGNCSFTFPDPILADRLQNAYFTCRWPSLPFLHRPSFLEQHFRPCLSRQNQANGVSLFLTLMVFALGAIDIKRQDSNFGNKHIEYFRFATENYLLVILREDSIQTVQGLLLLAQFAINEHQSANAWLIAGQAVRTAIDLGLHRNHATPSMGVNYVKAEMRKRVFWSTYAIDRNISITLGRPCAMRDEDIDVPFPLNITDNSLVEGSTPLNDCLKSSTHPLDMSTFIHIVKLRQIQSRIQGLFYSADASQVQTQGVQHYQVEIRSQLEEWISQAPRYSLPTMATFQSHDWFQIAYSHALLLLYRPSPANPIITPAALQICADSAISLISSYSSLYAKNKITYTWIALHSLFMASITMLYTLSVSPDIRASTTKAVVKSNVVSCLALFEVMGEYWPLATRCHSIIERVGGYTITLFDTPHPSARDVLDRSDTLGVPSEQHFGQIDAEFMEWFGMRNNYAPFSFSEFGNEAAPNEVSMNDLQGDQFNAGIDHLSGNLDISMDNIDDLLPAEFDTSIPMMITAFGNEMQLPMPVPRPPEASEMNDLANI